MVRAGRNYPGEEADSSDVHGYTLNMDIIGCGAPPMLTAKIVMLQIYSNLCCVYYFFKMWALIVKSGRLKRMRLKTENDAGLNSIEYLNQTLVCPGSGGGFAIRFLLFRRFFSFGLTHRRRVH